MRTNTSHRRSFRCRGAGRERGERGEDGVESHTTQTSTRLILSSHHTSHINPNDVKQYQPNQPDGNTICHVNATQSCCSCCCSCWTCGGGSSTAAAVREYHTCSPFSTLRHDNTHQLNHVSRGTTIIGKGKPKQSVICVDISSEVTLHALTYPCLRR